MKALIVGLGSIGKRHIENIKNLNPDIQISVWRQFSKEKGLNGLAPLVDNVFFSKDESLRWKPDVVFVTNPAPLHCETALIFVKQNSHLFIEKPLSVAVNGLDELLKESKKHDLILMVGYVLRFFEPIKIIKRIIEQKVLGRVLSISSTVGCHLLNWRPDKRYQDTVTARKDLGGGVLLELSHELDYVRWLVGEVSKVYAQSDKVSDLEVDVEDIAEVCLRFECGAIGSIHLDMIDHATNRSCRVIGTEGTVVWDSSLSDSVRLYSANTGTWSDLRPKVEIARNDMYKAELEHFLNCVSNKQKPLISGEDGKRVIEMITAAKKSIEIGEVVSI